LEKTFGRTDAISEVLPKKSSHKMLVHGHMNSWRSRYEALSSRSSRDEEMINIKVVDLDEFYNFYFYKFFSLNHLLTQNVV
jgi:hypothetical protein